LKFRKRARLSERGAVLPLIAVCLAALMGFAGMAVDIGYWEYQQRQEQNAVDAAAIGGAQQLAYSACPNQAAAKAAAVNDAAQNGFTDGSNGVNVVVQNPPQSGPFAGNNCAVYAQITRTGVASYFSRIFGFTPGVQETTQAVGLVTSDNPGCLYLLSQRAELNLNVAVILAPKCAVLANSSEVETLGAVIDVKSFGYAHELETNLLSLFLGAQPKPMLPVADPCPEITQCSYLANNPPAASGCTSFVNFSVLPVEVKPGCYSDFENNLGIVTMDPGTYVFTGPVNNTGVISGNGVTMYVTSTGGPVGFNGSVALLAPPASGPTAGVLFYQVPTNSNTVAFNASAQLSLAGLVYAPSSLGEILGQANITFGNYVVMVFSNLQTLAGVNLTLPGPPNGLSLVKRATLAE
jgi:Flp pilus assembly protein TadG